jgi:hypothetical protein
MNLQERNQNGIELNNYNIVHMVRTIEIQRYIEIKSTIYIYIYIYGLIINIDFYFYKYMIRGRKFYYLKFIIMEINNSKRREKEKHCFDGANTQL